MGDEEKRWKEWKERTFGNEYMIWHDGLYTDAVTSLSGAAREDALVMLQLGVSLGDAHAAEALAAMGDASSIDSMRAELAKAGGVDRVRMALALHSLAPEPALATHLVDVLRTAPLWSVRIDAAIGLRHFSGEDDERELLHAVEHDPDYLVRYHASSSLLVRWKITPSDVSKHPDLFERICGPQDGKPNTPADLARFREARVMLERLRPTAP